MDQYSPGFLVDRLLRLDDIVFRMNRAALLDVLGKAESEKRYIEAFTVVSLYVESVITVFYVSEQAKDMGYGISGGFAAAIDSDKEVKKRYDALLKEDLYEKIRYLQVTKGVLKEQYATRLHNWRTEYRNAIFHNFIEYMMRPGDQLKKLCERGCEVISKISDEYWFKALEDSLVKTEKELGFYL